MRFFLNFEHKAKSSQNQKTTRKVLICCGLNGCKNSHAERQWSK